MPLTLSKVVYLNLLRKKLLHKVGLAFLIHQRVVLDKFTDGIIGINNLWRCCATLVSLSHLMIFLDIQCQDNFLTIDSLTHQGTVSAAFIRRTRLSSGTSTATLGALKP